MEPTKNRGILIAGATGYVGGRLVRLLEDKAASPGERLRCLARRPEVLRTRVGPATEVVQGDLANPESLPPAFEGIDIAYYLVHSLGSQSDFESEEERTAQHFAVAARNAGVRRIIYLGGLCDEKAPPSSHMRSRLRVGDVLRSSGIETIEFRASIIIGSGSLSFELIRALVQRLPVMITPRWVSVKAQPIAIQDVLAYLLAALDLEPASHRVYEIGGADRMSYVELMREYGQVVGLRRLFIPVPVLTPRLSS
ncbi:MAG: NAD(P)H-binding protein, partial [Proteobacteria bacterium]|nr:NAD(P)H-binding protein [Pseudomonadota bacterium]